MPYTTVVAGTTITASWGNANVRDQVVTPFANAAARASAITVPVEGMVSFLNDVNSLEVYNGVLWAQTKPDHGNVSTLENTTSTTYAELTTHGPECQNVMGSAALVMVSAYVNNSGANNSYMGFAVSGATTIAASDTQAASLVGTTAVSISGTFKVSLNPGANTITAKYRASAGTANFNFRSLTVWPLA